MDFEELPAGEDLHLYNWFFQIEASKKSPQADVNNANLEMWSTTQHGAL